MELENMKKIVTNVTSTTVRKASEQVRITKLELSKNGIEKEIDGIYAEIGRVCYTRVKNGVELGEGIAALCGDIDALARRIAQLETEIEAHKLERDKAEYRFRFDEKAGDPDIEVEIITDEPKEAAAPCEADASAAADAPAKTDPEPPAAAPAADGPHPGAPAEDPVNAPEGPAAQ